MIYWTYINFALFVIELIYLTVMRCTLTFEKVDSLRTVTNISSFVTGLWGVLGLIAIYRPEI